VQEANTVYNVYHLFLYAKEEKTPTPFSISVERVSGVGADPAKGKESAGELPWT